MNYNTTTVRIAVTDPVLLRTKELLADLGVDAELVGRIAEAHARDILATFTATADLPFDLSERWTPGERIKAHHRSDETAGGMVVRIERSLRVEDTVVVLLDGEDTVRSINSDIISHEVLATPPDPTAPHERGFVADGLTAPGVEEDSENEQLGERYTDVFEILREAEPQPIGSARLGELSAIAGLVSTAIKTLPASRHAMRYIDLESIIHTGMGKPRTMNGRQTYKILTYIKESY